MDPSSTNSNMIEDDSILSFLTTDFLESQTTANPNPFDSTHFFDPLPTDSDIKYQSLLHPPSPPTSVGTYSESSGSPHNSAADSCDEGSGSDVAMDSSPLEYWQYVYSDLTHPPSSTFPLLGDDVTQQQQLLQQQQQQQQPGSWPLFPNVEGALMQPLSGPGLFDNNTRNSNNATLQNNNSNPRTSLTKPSSQTPPSPVTSVKGERRPKKAKKLAAAPSQPTSLPQLAPLKPLVSLAPQPQPKAIASRIAPAPPSPPVSVHDAFTKQSPPLSPALLPAPATATSVTSSAASVSVTASQTLLGQPQASAAAAARRPSIVPALTPSLARSNPVLVKSTLIPDEKPQSEAVMTAHAKRQERLIKNRAAALLSRKRKREHINLLESHTDLLKMDNQELKERVTELEENVKVLTEERDSALEECERLQRQVIILSHRPHSDTLRVDMDIERNARGMDTERGLNSKATGVVFMIILFSFALFNLPGGKMQTLMVGGRSVDRPRIGSGIVGRALNSYTKNPTISGQVRDANNNNMTDLIVFSDNRALQTWLGHQPVTVPVKAKTPVMTAAAPSSQFPVETPDEAVKTAESPAMEIETEAVKSVGFVAQSPEQLHWTARPDVRPEDMAEPDRDAWLYCSNLLYSLRSASVSKAAGSAQATNGEIRRPRLSLLSPLDGVLGSNTAGAEKNQYPPWMPNGGQASADGGSTEQRYLRLDVEVTSSRVVSGKGLGDHEQVIRFPIIPVGMFDNSTTADQGFENATAAAATSLVPSSPHVAKASSTPIPAYIRRREHQARVSSAAAAAASATASTSSNSRVGPKGGVVKTRRIYDNKGTFFKVAHAASRSSSNPMNSFLTPIKEEEMEVYIKDEPMD